MRAAQVVVALFAFSSATWAGTGRGLRLAAHPAGIRSPIPDVAVTRENTRIVIVDGKVVRLSERGAVSLFVVNCLDVAIRREEVVAEPIRQRKEKALGGAVVGVLGPAPRRGRVAADQLSVAELGHGHGGRQVVALGVEVFGVHGKISLAVD